MSLTELKVAQWGQIHSLYLPLYIADRKGLFAAHGLRLNLKLSGNDDETFAAVASKRADFGVGDPAFCAMTVNRRYEVRVIATLVNRAGVYGYTTNPVIPRIAAGGDLVNLRVGSLPRPSTTYSLIASLKQNNRRLLRSMRIVEAPIGEQFSLLAAGKADIVLDIEPFASVAESSGCRVIYSFAELHGPYAFTGFYTRRDVIEHNPSLVQSAISAMQEAVELLHRDPTAAFEVSAELFPELTRETIERSVRRLLEDGVWEKNLRTEDASWQSALQTREMIGDKFAADALSYIDNRFAEAACRRST